uniref:Uncharacterized protein n=1 Tax=Electrophorus electricus TaxID=8005 RepID=A0A4W4HLT7_ELEEL
MGALWARRDVRENRAAALPKHSYWFDFWAFVLFDIAFFIFIISSVHKGLCYSLFTVFVVCKCQGRLPTYNREDGLVFILFFSIFPLRITTGLKETGLPVQTS